MNIGEARTTLSRLIRQAESGEEVVIARDGEPVVRLVRFAPERRARVPGRWKGQTRIAPDSDDPLPPEIQSACEGEGRSWRRGMKMRLAVVERGTRAARRWTRAAESGAARACRPAYSPPPLPSGRSHSSASGRPQ